MINFQTLNSISAEKNSTIIFPLPIDLITHLLGNKKVHTHTHAHTHTHTGTHTHAHVITMQHFTSVQLMFALFYNEI